MADQIEPVQEPDGRRGHGYHHTTISGDARVHMGDHFVNNYHETSEKDKIMAWLSSPDPSTNYNKALKQRYQDTGVWFLEGERFDTWKSTPAAFMWLYGAPGRGKTVLSSGIFQDVRQICEADPTKVMAYFYFDFNDTTKQSPIHMLKSLLIQLSTKCLRSPTPLESLFSSCGTGARQRSEEALVESLKQLLLDFPACYLILDALDECTDQTHLLDILETFAIWKYQQVHILVTSRREKRIEDVLQHLVAVENRVCLESRLIDKDTCTYVRRRLNDDRNLKRWQKDPSMRAEIEKTLTKEADGM